MTTKVIATVKCVGVGRHQWIAKRGYKKGTDISVDPSGYYGVNTLYGWFTIPKTHYGYDFTETRLNECIKQKIEEGSSGPWPLTRIQTEIVDAWVDATPKSGIPKVKSTTKRAKAAREIEDLYVEQMREVVEPEQLSTTELESDSKDITEKKSTSTTKATSKTPVDASALKTVHAWNYYVQLNTPKYKHLSTTEARRAIGQAWRDLSLLEKEKYKQELSEMLKSGVSIYNGKTIPLEEKEKYLKRFKVFKERSKKRMLKRAMAATDTL